MASPRKEVHAGRITWSVIESYDGGGVTAFVDLPAYRGNLYGGGYEWMTSFVRNSVCSRRVIGHHSFWQLRSDLSFVAA